MIQSELPSIALAYAPRNGTNAYSIAYVTAATTYADEQEPAPAVVEEHVRGDERGEEPVRVLRAVARTECDDDHEDHRDEEEQALGCQRRLAPQAEDEPDDQRRAPRV